MIVMQNTLDVNNFELREARLSCIHFVPMLALLQARNPPEIACKFLLDDVSYTNAYGQAIKGVAPWQLPWRDGYAKLFWRRYAPNSSLDELRRALVPIEFNLSSAISFLKLADGKVDARAFVYPWGIGILIDISFNRSLPLAKAVDRLIEIRNRSSVAWKIGSSSGAASPAGVASEIQKCLIPTLYGADINTEGLGEQFSIATVVDAADIVVTDPIPENGSLHQVLEGLVGWKSKWGLIQPEANSLVKFKMPSASAPAGHIVYGKSRSRAVWFPANFRSVADYPETLCCYHQNLSMATLHTEALCVLAQDAASQLSVQASLADFSVTYRNCARLAAGLLGRLHGRKSDESVGTKPSTYRSGSVRTQILLYKDEIDKLRLALLAPGTPLDA